MSILVPAGGLQFGYPVQWEGRRKELIRPEGKLTG